MHKAMDFPDNHITSQAATISGMWYRPISVGGTAGLDQYHDISKFLTLHRIPMTLLGENGTKIDIAASIANALFQHAPPQFSKFSQADLEAGKSPIKEVHTEIISRAGDCIIRASHAYYEVPLGQAANESAWHGGVHVKWSGTGQFVIAHYAGLGGQFIGEEAEESSEPTQGPRWLVTIRVEWTSTTFAATAWSKFPELLKAKYSGFELRINSLLGATQILKILAPSGVAPAAVRQLVIIICAELVAQSSGKHLQEITPPALEALPLITIVNTSIVI